MLVHHRHSRRAPLRLRGERLENRIVLATAYSLDLIATESFVNSPVLDDVGHVVYGTREFENPRVWRSTAEVEAESLAPTEVTPRFEGASKFASFFALDANDRNNLVGATSNDEYLLWSADSSETPQRLASDVRAPTTDLETSPLYVATYAHRLVVIYADEFGVDEQTFDGADVRVVNGEGTQLGGVQFVSAMRGIYGEGGERWRVEYEVQGPGNSWDATDNGYYDVYLNAHQVSDRAKSLLGAQDDGNFAAPGRLGTFRVDIDPKKDSEAAPPPSQLDGAQAAPFDRSGPIPIKARLDRLISLNNSGTLAFAAEAYADASWREYVALWNGSSIIASAQVEGRPNRLDLADTGELMVQVRTDVASSRDEIRLYSGDLGAVQTIAPAAEYFVYGGASISDDGQVIAFAAYREELGQAGVYVSLAPQGRSNVLAAGVLGKGELLPHQSWTDLNRNEIFDANELAGPRYTVNSTVVVGSRMLEAASDFTLAWSGSFSTHGQNYQGVIAMSVKYDWLRHEILASEPTLVAGIGGSHDMPDQTFWPESLGRQANLNAADTHPIKVTDVNAQGQVLLDIQGDTLVRATPFRRPLLLIHGIFGAFPTQNVSDWLMTRGVPPETMQIDPLARSYDSFLEWLGLQGYEPGRDLYIVVYDWRLPLAPQDNVIDGQIEGVTGASISDRVWEYGLDYLGDVLKRAAENWARDHKGRELDMVDVVAHSMGGLLARSYVQSTAYGDVGTGGVRLPKIDSLITVGTPHAGAAKAWNPLQNNFGGDPAYKLFFRPMLRAVLEKVESGATIGRHAEAGNTVTPLAREDLAGLPPGDRGQRLLELYAPSVRALLATFDFLDLNLEDGAPVLENVNDDPAANNSLLLDLNNGYNPSDFASLPICGPYYGCGGQTPGPDPASFADKTNATVIYGADRPTVVIVRAWDGDERSATLYPIDGDATTPAVGQTWWEDDSGSSPVRPTAPEFRGDGTVPVLGAIGIVQRDYRVRTHRVMEDRSFAHSDPSAIAVGPAGDSSHNGLLQTHQVQRLILSRLGQLEQDERLIRPSGVDLFAAGADIVTFWADPAEVVLVDAEGKRVGWTESTGPLAEIPGSAYFGEAEGFGWMPADSIVGPLELRIRGLGETYFVMTVVDSQEASFEFVVRGVLAAGEEESFEIAPRAARSWRNPKIPEDVDDSGGVDLNDLLTLVNYLREHPDGALPESPRTPPPFYDVNGDDVATIADLLHVVTVLRVAVLGEGEGMVGKSTASPGASLVAVQRHRAWIADATFAQSAWLTEAVSQARVQQNSPAPQPPTRAASEAARRRPAIRSWNGKPTGTVAAKPPTTELLDLTPDDCLHF
jgi:hypothetical protein